MQATLLIDSKGFNMQPKPLDYLPIAGAVAVAVGFLISVEATFICVTVLSVIGYVLSSLKP